MATLNLNKYNLSKINLPNIGELLSRLKNLLKRKEIDHYANSLKLDQEISIGDEKLSDKIKAKNDYNRALYYTNTQIR